MLLTERHWTVPTVRDTLAQFTAPISLPPPRPKTWDCGCRGRSHFVCDPTWAKVKAWQSEAKPLRPLTLKQALRQGLTLRPHVTHTFHAFGEPTYHATGRRCDCGAAEERTG